MTNRQIYEAWDKARTLPLTLRLKPERQATYNHPTDKVDIVKIKAVEGRAKIWLLASGSNENGYDYFQPSDFIGLAN